MQKIKIENKTCYMKQNGVKGPIILWGMYSHQGNEITHMWNCLMDIVKEKDFALYAFQVEDWNRDFSPWKAPAAFGNEDFQGKADKTLQWLTNNLIPTIKERYGLDREIYLIGYSLSGLFSLWAAYETDIFSGIASCSGSLWFEKWDEYLKIHKMQHTCNVYLSLGGKEEKTKNQIMAKVGERTRLQEQILKEDQNVQKVTLEYNSGGHFADSGKRLSKAVYWLLNNTSQKGNKKNESKK